MSQTDTPVTLYHNPNCSKSRGALELLGDLTQREAIELRVIEYLDSPPSREDLLEVITALLAAPQELVRHDKNFKALGLAAESYTSKEDIVELLLAHPQLMQRPIAVYKNKALIGRPPEALEALFL